ncbi:MraY family glycosyltransferase [Prevotella disiens]|uniref:MraY family glycosyltransferase n=1 Tax=Prevotella disiens TaxID=28130 RepID=UPI0024303B67|nr:MraY family glycosyltransferase [Prevotella disiens]
MKIYILISLLAFTLSITCGFIFIPRILNFCKNRNLYDIPNQRKVHKNAIPRLGGVSFLPSMLIATIIALLAWSYTNDGKKIEISPWTIYFALGLFIIYAIGLIDDVFGVSAKKKLLVQIFVSSLPPIAWLYINNFYGFLGIEQVSFWVGAPLTVFILVFIMNAINLIDGIDGLSAGLSLIALVGFFYCFFSESIWIYSILIAGLIGVLIPFLYYNVFGDAEKGQKIFMGDSGSLTLGYILGILLVKFSMDTPLVKDYKRVSIFLAMTLMMVPVFDVCRVVIVRKLHGHNIFQPDKNHIHHKFMRAGLTQHQSLAAILGMAITFIVLNVSLYSIFDTTILILGDIVIYTLFHLLLLNRWIRKNKQLPFME